MKKLSPSTKPAKVKERVADLQLVEASYRLLKPVLDHLTLGQDGIQYYAYGVTHSLDPEQLAELKATLVTELSEEDYYLILSSKSVRMQNRVGPILKAVTFLAEPSAKDLHRAMENFRLKVLTDLDAALYRQYLTTNTHILDGKNPHIKFKKVGFTVSTPTLEESNAEALQHYERDFVPLMELLATVNRHSGWIGEFQHWQQRHHHGRPEDRVMYAGVIGIGCAIGIRKTARISHPISESELEKCRQLVLLGG